MRGNPAWRGLGQLAEWLDPLSRGWASWAGVWDQTMSRWCAEWVHVCLSSNHGRQESYGVHFNWRTARRLRKERARRHLSQGTLSLQGPASFVFGTVCECCCRALAAKWTVRKEKGASHPTLDDVASRLLDAGRFSLWGDLGVHQNDARTGEGPRRGCSRLNYRRRFSEEHGSLAPSRGSQSFSPASSLFSFFTLSFLGGGDFFGVAVLITRPGGAKQLLLTRPRHSAPSRLGHSWEAYS